MPVYDYGQVSKESLDEIGKFVQRVSAVSMMPKAPQVINWILKQADIPYSVDEDASAEDLNNLLTPMTSRSGDGLEEGLPGGTGNNSGSSGDSSTGNTENA